MEGGRLRIRLQSKRWGQKDKSWPGILFFLSSCESLSSPGQNPSSVPVPALRNFILIFLTPSLCLDRFPFLLSLSRKSIIFSPPWPERADRFVTRHSLWQFREWTQHTLEISASSPILITARPRFQTDCFIGQAQSPPGRWRTSCLIRWIWKESGGLRSKLTRLQCFTRRRMARLTS